MQIPNYFIKIGFNYYQKSSKLADPIKGCIVINCNNKVEVIFVGNNSYYQSAILQFSRLNADIFYSLINQQLVSWKLFCGF